MNASKLSIGSESLSSGPLWGRELLSRLRKDPRFFQGVSSEVRHWEDLPVATSLPKQTPLQLAEAGSLLGYLSSGTSGEPKRIFFNQQDWNECVTHRAECLRSVGVTGDHVAMVVLPFGPWFSGDNISAALRQLGVDVLSVGAYVPHLPNAVDLMRELSVDTLVTLPSTALALTRISREMDQRGNYAWSGHLSRIILVGEPVSTSVRRHVEQSIGGTTHCLFAASEAVIGYEDNSTEGLYRWNPERVYLEVLQDDGRIMRQGEGDLLVTSRYSTTQPVVRYRLGDRVRLNAIEPADAASGSFRHLGRNGQAFRLPTGVQVGYPLLERFMESLRPDVEHLLFRVSHHDNGSALLEIALERVPPGISQDEIIHRFTALSLDVADVVASGFLKIKIIKWPDMEQRGKSIQVIETSFSC